MHVGTLDYQMVYLLPSLPQPLSPSYEGALKSFNTCFPLTCKSRLRFERNAVSLHCYEFAPQGGRELGLRVRERDFSIPKETQCEPSPFLWSLCFKTESLPSLSLPVPFTCLGRIFIIWLSSKSFWRCPYSVDKASCTFGDKRKTKTEEWAQEEPAPRRWQSWDKLGPLATCICSLGDSLGNYLTWEGQVYSVDSACLKPTVTPGDWVNKEEGPQ